MEKKLNIPIIIGTSRVNRESIKPAKLIAEIGQSIAEISVSLVDPLDFNLPNDGNDEGFKDSKYTEITKAADGFIIVTPEYNHSYSGSLKRLLDSELENYIHKPVAFAGVSSTPWGGVRAIEALVNTVREMGLSASFTDLYFPMVQTLFNMEGKILDHKYESRIKKFYGELIWLAKIFKYGRANLAKA